MGVPDEYESRLVTFIDILGFEEIVKIEEKPLRIHQILEQLKRWAIFSADTAQLTGQRFVNFSDCCVRTAPLFTSDLHLDVSSSCIVALEVLDLAIIQRILIKTERVFLRGAMTVGEVYHEGTEIFGPGMIMAYKLERYLAVFPRIMVDPRILKLYIETPSLKSNHHTDEKEKEFIRRNIRRGEDGILFIDYLKIFGNKSDDPSDDLDFLRDHKKAILEKAKMSKNIKVASKYNWLANYHNTVIQEHGDQYFKSFGYSIEAFTITAAEMPTNYDF